MNKQLKLRAETTEDIGVISAALQDAIGRVEDVKYNAASRALTLRVTRFRHEGGEKSERILTGLRVDSVLDVKSRGIDRSDPKAMMVLLAIEYVPDDQPPGGNLKLTFAGGGELAAQVECIDLILADVSDARTTDKTPLHPDVTG